MAIEIRELVIKVKIEEPLNKTSYSINTHQMKQEILKECKKEIKKQFSRFRER